MLALATAPNVQLKSPTVLYALASSPSICGWEQDNAFNFVLQAPLASIIPVSHALLLALLVILLLITVPLALLDTFTSTQLPH